MKALKDLSFDELVEVRDTADRLISQRASAQRKLLEEQLARLARVTGAIGTKKPTVENKAPTARGRGAKKGGKAVPKYANPANPSETWAGRGMTPRWLKALVEQGAKPEEFAIKNPHLGE
jgi:DNA-binding protein H-NS